MTDSAGQKLAYVYFEDEPGRRSAAKLLTNAHSHGALATLPLSTPIPAYDSVCRDGQSSSTGGTYYHLADDRNDVETPQRWDQELKDFCAYNTAYSFPQPRFGRDLGRNSSSVNREPQSRLRARQ